MRRDIDGWKRHVSVSVSVGVGSDKNVVEMDTPEGESRENSVGIPARLLTQQEKVTWFYGS